MASDTRPPAERPWPSTEQTSSQILSSDRELESDKLTDWEWGTLPAAWHGDEDLMRAKVAINSYRNICENRQTIVERASQNDPGTSDSDDGEFKRRGLTGRDRRNSKLWVIAFAGITVFSFGAVLTSWSVLYDHSDLWRIGLLALLVGQAILMLGLAIQFERLRQVFGRDSSIRK